MNEMRIEGSLSLSLSLSLVYRRDLFVVVVVGKDILSCSQQAKEKEGTCIDTIRYDALRWIVPGGVDKSRQVLIDARDNRLPCQRVKEYHHSKFDLYLLI